MKKTLASLLTVILVTLGLLHLYWAVGGKWGFANSLPSNAEGVKVLAPTAVDCVVVGVLLITCGLFYQVLADTLKLKLPTWLKKVALWAIPIVFSLRALGDFQYVGFFKQITSTEFARLDTLFYSPLCLALGLMGLVLIRWK